MDLSTTRMTMLCFMALVGFGQTRHCYLHFNLHYLGQVHDWQFMEVDVGNSGPFGCHDTEKDCRNNAQGWTDNFLGQAVPPVSTGSAAKTLCKHYNIEILPDQHAYVDLWWKSSSCGNGGPISLGELCCDKVNGAIVPNDGCQPKLDKN